MWTLILNCGSSSVKFAVLDPASGQVRLTGLAEKLGAGAEHATPAPGTGATIRFEVDGERQHRPLTSGTYAEAFDAIGQRIRTLPDPPSIGAVGHRTVHGGTRFSGSVLITPEVLDAMRECIPLAPLHNPANIAGIEAAQAAFPGLPQVAVFDTAFHHTLPDVAARYAVPDTWYREYGVRRYGFHGTSHAYVARRAAPMLDRPLEDLNLITAHLGNGSSVCAVQGGQSVDTSMGLTPLEGLVMGTRSGDVDPGLHEFMHNTAGLTLEQVMTALNKHSGLKGLSGGLSNDMRELEEAAHSGHAAAQFALDAFVYRLAKYVAGMAVALGRVDGLVFTGGIGENSAYIRQRTVERLGVLGFHLDAEANANLPRGTRGLISAPGSVPVLVVTTNEELAIALETLRLVTGDPEDRPALTEEHPA
jgi:acetate kinase